MHFGARIFHRLLRPPTLLPQLGDLVLVVLGEWEENKLATCFRNGIDGGDREGGVGETWMVLVVMAVVIVCGEVVFVFPFLY